MHEPTEPNPGAPAGPSAPYYQLLERLPSGAYACDSEGLITYFNQQAVRLWGREPKLNDPVDRYCGSFKLFTMDGKPISHDQCWMALALQNQQNYDGQEILIERPDGSRVAALAHASPVHDGNGKLIGAVNVLVDITRRKELENSLKESERRKDEFLATLAHELRNPLAPICNSLHLMRLSDDLSPPIERVREIMERQVNLMVRLVDDLLEVSRITRGKIELRREVVDLAAVVRSAVETSRPAIEAARHQLAISFPTEPLRLDADPVRLAQVISNLLNNAAKFTKDGGQIWLTVREDAGMAVISVRDNGLGIPPATLPHVFDLFAQVDRLLNRSQSGLGIGLTLAKSLIEMHGGNIEARSNGIGHGSEFVVRLPIATGQEPSAQTPLVAPSGARLPAASHRILVLDDTPSAAYILGKLLEKLGHKVQTTHDAATALELARTERPDVVISDISMPRIDGYEFARRLRQEPGMEFVMLVALTGFGQKDDRQQAINAGFDFHLVKPVSLEALQETLERYQRSHFTRGADQLRKELSN